MARKLIVEVIADAAKFIAGMEMSSKAVNGFGADVEKVSVSTELAAKAQVAAAIKTTESLKTESAAYHQLAAAAVKGSQEQIAAANLAAAADRKLAASMGIAGAETATFRGHTTGLGKDLEHTARGALSGSHIMEGFGRSLAFASGGFVAFAGASEFLRGSIDAARDAGVAQRSLAAQMKASGESFTANQQVIEKASLSLEKFGFTSEDSQKALTVLERGTKSITTAISLQGVAANLARAKNIDLASAANVLAKVFGGQETALRRAVPGLAKHEHGLALIADAERRLAGQAGAATTEAEKFHAILHNTEVIVGTALLPTLNKFLEALGKWLQKMNESGRLQKDVNEAVQAATGIFNEAKIALDDLNKVTGSTTATLKLLFEAFAAFKITKWISALGLLGTSIKGIGTQAEGATAATSRLSGALGALAAIGVVTVQIQEEIVQKKARQALADQGGSPVLALDPGAAVGKHQTRNGVPGTFKMISGQLWWMPDQRAGVPGPTGPLGTRLAGPLGAVDPRAGIPNLKIPGGIYGNTAAPLTAGQQRAIGLAADPSNLKLLRQQAAHDQAALDFAKKLRASGRISNQKYVEEVTHYASDLQQTNSTIAGILQAARQKTADATKAAADAAKAAAEKQKQAAQAARQHVLAVAQLAVTRAQATPGYQDDLATQQHLVEILKKQLAADRQNVDLQTQLFDAEQAVKATLKQRADTAKQAKLDAGQLAIARAGLTTSSQDDLASQEKYLQILRATHASALDIANQQNVIKGVRDQIAQQNKQDAADAKQRAKDAAAAAKARRDALQFGLLGLGPTGGAIVPGVANLKTRLTGIREAVKGTFLDTPKTGSELDHIAKILSGKFGNVSETVRASIDQMYKDIRDKLKTSSERVFVRRVSSQNFVDSLGLNLTGAQRRRIEAQFARIGPGATAPGGRSLAFSGGNAIVINGGLHMHGVQDIPGLENEFAKRTKARGHVRRGSR